ncbi:hypothetical protein N658DRAFT_106065 [Parathielavia hyrcaniae]|uniref:Uncharacterized protein n=1 Tax=Parathielavia hyrcaniae TaxID=113614 RepID=A0AAN6Q217_9PEZI|nr:hypothetical protein N658DRAFT_106065 [Parathielavia hyrcaniae]
MKRASSLLLAAGLAAAQSTTVVDILMPMADPQTLLASVISADATATSYFISCPTVTSSEECGFADGLEVLNGPSTMNYAMTISETYTLSADCQLQPTANLGVCTASMISGASTSTTVDTLSDYSSFFIPVTVTAGLERLSATTTPSTGGMPQITQNAVLAGAAALVGGAMLL